MQKTELYEKLHELAEKAGYPDLWRVYEGRRKEMEDSPESWAVLGVQGAGKTTVRRFLELEKKAEWTEPEADGNGFLLRTPQNRWDSPLWLVDAAILVISCTMPLSRQDMDYLELCRSHGIPCAVILTRGDLLRTGEEESPEEIADYIRENTGLQEVFLFEKGNQASVAPAVCALEEAGEIDRQLRKYLLGYCLLEEMILRLEKDRKNREEAIDRLQEEKQETARQLEEEQLEWERLQTELRIRGSSLQEDVQAEMEEIREIIRDRMVEDMNRAADKAKWWDTVKDRRMTKYNQIYAKKLNRFISDRIEKDRDWLIREVDQKFGLIFRTDAAQPEVEFKNASWDSRVGTEYGKKRKIAGAALALSAVGIVGGLLLAPAPLLVGEIFSACWKVSGVTALGSGVWYASESSQDRQRMEQMETEVSNYVHSCCRTNLKNIQETVSYIYRQMVLAAEELQVERSVPRDAGTDEEETGIKETEWLLGQCLELKRAILE